MDEFHNVMRCGSDIGKLLLVSPSSPLLPLPRTDQGEG